MDRHTTITASYAGRCGSCNDLFAPGDEVFYTEGDLLVAVNCCGAAEPLTAESEVTPASKVMPRGKTAKDRCDTCFQVPATNGVCGCA